MNAPWPSEYLILGLLAEKPMHGYELSRLLAAEQNLNDIWRLKRSEVYFLLRKLVDLGYVREAKASRPAGAPSAGPARVVYAPTPTGEAALVSWLKLPEKTPRDLRAAFLVKLYLTLRRDRGQARALLVAQHEVLARWSERHSAAPSGDLFGAMVQTLRAAQVQADLVALEQMAVMMEEPDWQGLAGLSLGAPGG